MKRQFWGLLLVGMLLGLAQPAWGDDLYVVIAAGGVGTPITSAPYTISQPGFYYLKGNLGSTGDGAAITIAASEVTLDLMGFSITGPGSNSGYGIYINNSMNNVEVRNGSVKNFYVGINGLAGINRRLAHLRVRGCDQGIYDSSHGAIITGCQAVYNTNTGIRSDGTDVIVDKNTSCYNASGFYLEVGGVVTNNAASNNGTGFQLLGSTSQLVDRNASYANTTANWSNLDGCTKGLNTP